MPDVTVPKPQLDASVYRSGFRAAYGSDLVKQLMATEYLRLLYGRNPNMNKEQAVFEVQRWMDKFDKEVTRGESPAYQASKARNDKWLWGVELGTKLPLVNILGGEAIRDLYKKYVDDAINKQWAPINQFTATQEQHKNWLKIRGREDEILDKALEDARKNPLLKDVLDTLHARGTGVSVDDISATKVIDNNPKFKTRVSPQIRQCIQPDGSLVMSLDELRKLSKEQHGAVMAVMGQQLDLLNNIEQNQKELLAWTKQQDKRRELEELTQRKAAEQQAVLEGVGSTVYLLSTFVGFADAKLGREISVVGNAGIQIAEAIISYSKTAAALADLGKLGEALGGAILAGNIVGAAMNIVGLFIEQGPTPEQMILDEIGQLRDQVGRLRTEMHDRFDRIDRGLNEIYSTLNDRFNEMARGLDRLRRDSSRIQQDLLSIQGRLDRMMANIRSYIQTQGRRELVTNINGAVDYDVSRPNPMTFDKYEIYENVFFSWATQHAKDEVETGSGQRSFRDEDVAAELSGPLDSNIMYLNDWIRFRNGHLAFAPDRLANPTTWAISARAYAELGIDWPEHAKQLSLDRRAEVSAVGEELINALQRITLTETEEPNHSLFRVLIDNYKEQCSAWDTTLQHVEREYVDDWKQKAGRRDDPDIDYWGKTDQQTQYSPKGMQSMNAGAPQALSAPGNLREFIAAPYFLADYLKLDSAGLVTNYALNFEDVEEILHPRTEEVTGIKCQLYVAVSVSYNGALIFTRSLALGERSRGVQDSDTIGAFGRIKAAAYAEVQQQWEQGMRARFEQNSFEVSPNADEQSARKELLEQVTKRVDDGLRAHLANIYNLAQLNPQSNVVRHVTAKVSGAKALLSGFINLGMPRALAADDYLRSFLYGYQSLPDERQISARYVEVATASERQSVNVRSLIKSDSDRRADALGELLSGYLEQQAKKQHFESQPYLEDTLLRLNIAEAVTLSPV